MSQYKESVLENGLRVITKEDKNSPIITMGLFVNAGSRYEKEDEGGYAHILEHMLLRGTAKRPEAFGRELTRKGGYSNAHTNNEYLWFDAVATKEDREIIFDLLSDLLLNAKIDEDVLENEKRVILEERRKAYENNERLARMLSREIILKNHPLSREVVGTVESIKSATSDKLRKYLNNFIVPKNAALVVIGVDSHKETAFLANKYFSMWFSELEIQKGVETSLTVKDKYYFQKVEGNSYNLAISYLTPSAKNMRQNAALSVIANFLGMGGDSLLAKELRLKRGLIYSYKSFNNPYTDTGRFNIYTATSAPTETIGVIFDCIKNLTKYFTPDLLEEIKTQIINSFIIRNTNPSTELAFIGERFILNDRFLSPEEYISFLSDVKYEDILDVWKKYLQPENSLTVVLGPKDIKEELGV